MNELEPRTDTSKPGTDRRRLRQVLKIPAIDLIEGRCVRLFQGDYGRRTTYSTDPAEQARRFQAAGFPRVHVVDLEGARDGSGRNRLAIRRVVQGCRVPVQVGGGIRSDRDVDELLGLGAAYLILGTTALVEPDLVGRWIGRWSPERFIVSLDFRRGRLQTEGWTEEVDVDLDEVLERIRGWGVAEVISTDVERDGTLAQPNYETYRLLVRRLSPAVTVVAAGGVSRPEHIRLLGDVGVRGVIIGRALYEGDCSWEELLNAG
jgi:phosphoribosylformimino-5-aminoimidazole carboxamide ribotide isomerase